MYDQLKYNSRYRAGLSNIIGFYKEQIRRFNKIGIGNKTEFRTVVTEHLIEVTERRLKELQDQKSGLARKVHDNGFK